MVSRTHFLTEFNLHLVDLTFVPKVHNGVHMGLRGIDELLFMLCYVSIYLFQRAMLYGNLYIYIFKFLFIVNCSEVLGELQ
jgi:hypothetical protein